jgi:ribosome-associated protein
MPQSVNDIDEIEEELKSKSEIKREMISLQAFAQKIIEMSKHQRSKLPLSDELKADMILADKITNKHEALKRHIRHVAKVLSEMDLEPIQQALDVMANKHQQETTKFIRLEALRDKLITEGSPAIEELLAQNSQMERQKLRQLVRQAAKEYKAEKPGKYYKTLFLYIKTNSTTV